MASLKQVIERDGPLEFRLAARCIGEVAMQLSSLHGRGILHRNVCPAAILIDDSGRAELAHQKLRYDDEFLSLEDADAFDIADYLAPEQALNNLTADARADIYNLGCTFYFMLTGRPPFAVGSVSERLLQHQVAPVPDVAADRPGAPIALVNLCKRMMSKNRAERPASAAEVAAVLNVWLADQDAA